MKANVRIGDMEFAGIADHTLKTTPFYKLGGGLSGDIDELEVFVTVEIHDRESVRKALAVFSESGPIEASIQAPREDVKRERED